LQGNNSVFPIAYVNAGVVSCCLSEGKLRHLEINTRLQLARVTDLQKHENTFSSKKNITAKPGVHKFLKKKI